MRVVDVIRGVLTGYGFRLLQVVATLVVVPFLLHDEIFGLERYGRIFAILGILSPITLITDGLRTSFARSIARSLSDGSSSTGREIGNAFKIIGGINLGLAIVLFALRYQLLDLIGVPRDSDYSIGISLAILFIAMEDLFSVLLGQMNARGVMDAANAIMSIELIARNLSFVAWFSIHGGSVSHYFAIFVIGAGFKLFALLTYSIRRWPEDFVGFWSGTVASAAGAVLYSFPISGVSLNFYLFERLTIPLTARFIGPTEAGLLALGTQTIANNLSQMLFNVVRPLLVPIASRIQFDRLSDSRRRLLLDLDAFYILATGSFSAAIIATMPTLVTLWLGEEKSGLIFPAQLLVAGSGISMAFNIRRALLVGQGHANEIARISFVCGALGLGGLVWFLVLRPSWIGVALVTASVTASASVFGVAFVFDRSRLAGEGARKHLGLRATVTLVLGVASAFAGARLAPVGLTMYVVVLPAISTITTILAGHFLMIRGTEMIRSISTLRAGVRRQIFDDAADPPS